MAIAAETAEQAARVSFQRVAGEYALDDLWFMVGSRCNLRCIHCYVESSPENDSLEQLTLDDVLRFLEEGRAYHMKHVYFTGGEPFLNRDIAKMVKAGLEVADVSVLTNATSPVRQFLGELESLNRTFPSKLTMRISLDHYDEARHEAIRGTGTFQKTVDHAVALARAGLRCIITVTPEVFRGNPVSIEYVKKALTTLFDRYGVDMDVKVLPAVLEMGAQRRRLARPSHVTPLTESRMKQNRVDVKTLMCHSGRSVLKKDGTCRVYPCPIIYEVPEFELGRTLRASLAQPVSLSHHACASYCGLSTAGGGGHGSCTD